MKDNETPRLLSSIPKDSPAHRQLVTSLKRLRDEAKSEEDARMYDDILKGRRAVQDVLQSSQFNELAAKGFQRYQDERAKLSDQEKVEADRLAVAEAERLFGPLD